MRLLTVPLAGLPASSPFLGQVALSPVLGQVEFTDPWGARHTFTAELPGPPILPFDPRQSLAYQDRIQRLQPQIQKTQQECDVLKANLEAHKSNYFDNEAAGEAEYQGYVNATNAYNKCVEKVDLLTHEMDFGPSAPTTTNIDYQWPEEVPKPEDYEQPLPPQLKPEPPPVASVDQRPMTTTEGIQQATSMTTCRPGQFVDPVTRQCRGSVSSGFSSVASTAFGAVPAAAAAATSAVLQGRMRPVPLYPGRF